MAYRGLLTQAMSLFFIFISSATQAQRCETWEYYKKHPLSNFTGLRITEQDKTAKDTTPNQVIIVPVVVHIIYNTVQQNISDAQVLSQLQSLNNDYRKLNADANHAPAVFGAVSADTRIVFCLARTDPSGKATSGIIRKYTGAQSWLADDGMKFTAQGGDNAWDSRRYLNIWVCNLFGRSLGYSTVPGSEADKDGVVIQYDAFGSVGNVTAPFNKGRTLTHETGHWLGLKHLWGDANCGDDGIADTPPQQNFNNGCPSFPHKTSCSVNGNGDMFMNFMDFTDDGCMNMFTKEQAAKMRSLFAVGGARNSFLNSTVCESNAVQRAVLPIATPVSKAPIAVFPNPAVQFINVESKNMAELTGQLLTICNVYGAKVKSQLLTAQKTTIPVQHLPAGIYFIKIGEGKENKPLRFVKD